MIVPSKVAIPAISREVEFIARHVDEVHEVQEGNVQADKTLLALLDAVYERAARDVRELLNYLQQTLDAEVRGLLRIKWGRVSADLWELQGVIHVPRSQKKRIGLVGIYVQRRKAPRLIGWVYPPAGLDGRRELARVSAKKVQGVQLASDYRQRYDWAAKDDAVVWFDEKLTSTSREDLRYQIQQRARSFFKVAKPTLTYLAGQT